MPAVTWLSPGGERANFAEGSGPGSHVAGLQPALRRRGVAWGDFVECLVYDGLHCGNSEE
jgi:hypothetical protein